MHPEEPGDLLRDLPFGTSVTRRTLCTVSAPLVLPLRPGVTILLNEQNARMALSVADRAYVLETGRISMEGDASELLNDERVQKAYLGG